MTRLGYARVSSIQQGSSLAAQKSLLEAAGCSVIRAESVSGGSRTGQSELQTLLDFVREGDQLCVVKLDRLGRSASGVLAIVDELRAKKASLRVLQPPLSTDDSVTGQMMIAVLSVVAEAELANIRERQKQGIERRKEIDKTLPANKRAYRGRRRTVSFEAIKTLKAEGQGVTEIASRLGVSRMTVYRALA
jgi:DNA invertase Pin-like site-specific DNA recombinase